MTLWGEAKREASSDGASPYPELCPTCAEPAVSKRQRLEWVSCVNLHSAQDLAQQSDHPLELFGHGQSPLTDMIVGKLCQPFPGSVDFAAIDH